MELGCFHPCAPLTERDGAFTWASSFSRCRLKDDHGCFIPAGCFLDNENGPEPYHSHPILTHWILLATVLAPISLNSRCTTIMSRTVPLRGQDPSTTSLRSRLHSWLIKLRSHQATMDFISKLPDEILLQIFSNVSYDGQQGRSVRGISKKLDELVCDKLLPRSIAQEQYQSYYLVSETIHSAETFAWANLDALHQKSRAYQPWSALLPNVDQAILMTGNTLLDACYSINTSHTNRHF